MIMMDPFSPYGKKLIVFDDIDKNISEWIPSDPNAEYAVIATSRRNLIEEGLTAFKPIELKPLSTDSAIKFLKHYADEHQGTEENFAEIAKFVGCLPLGLILVGRFLKRHRTVKTSDFLENLTSQSIDTVVMEGIGEKDSYLRDDCGRHVYEGVYKILSYDWTELEESAKKLACVLGLFDITPKILGNHDLDSSVSLQSLSLITGDLKDEFLHPLVADFFFQKMMEDESCHHIDDLLFTNFVLQQYLYDANYLERRQKKLQAALASLGAKNNPNISKIEILLHKLLGHLFYGYGGEFLSQSISHMKNALNKIDALTESIPEKTIVAKWYQLFLCDHIYNQLSRNENSDSDEEAQRYQNKCLEILPAELKDLNKMPNQKHFSIQLRAAHYWGHRGNQAVESFRKSIARGQPSVSIGKEGIQHYLLAAVYRLGGVFK
jgi:hypothetical protein